MTAPTLALLATTAEGTGSSLTTLLPLVAFGVVMYFVVIRPQRRRQQEQQQLLDRLEVGAEVVTIGGLHGQVDDLGDDWVDLAVDVDGTVLRFSRTAIARTVSADTDTDGDTVEPAGADR